uniref:CST complex subunit CTC1 n=1 Tax=Chrysotila carterae TaxID=13221 RepID=A0A7S4BS43_CHRCT
MRCPSRWSQVTCNSGSLCVSRSGSCKLYLKLDMKAAIELDYSQERTSGRTEDADDDAEDSVVHGGGITETNLYAIALKMVKGAGVFRLRLTVTGLTRLWLHLRCTACAGVKQVLGPGGCCCPQYSQLPIASQEAKISSTSSAAAHEDENFVFEIGACAKVTDGTGKAFLDISGSNVWVLMQASNAVARKLQDAAAACGPLAFHYVWSEHTRSLRGEWRCSPQSHMDPAIRQTLTKAVISSTQRQRRFVACCRLQRPVEHDGDKQSSLMLGGQQSSTRVLGSVSLKAVYLQPISVRCDLERALKELSA